MMADIHDLNLVMLEEFSQPITLRLVDVPWDHALDVLLSTNSLDKRIERNVMIVGQSQALSERAKSLVNARTELDAVSPIETVRIPVNYADANAVKTVLAGDGSENSNTLLSERGSVQVLAWQNTLLVRDTSENIERIRTLIKEIDTPSKQVLIEARIVDASTDWSRGFGVRWTGKGSAGDKLAVSGPWKTDDKLFPDAVKLPLAGATNGVAMAFVNDRLALGFALEAMEAEGDGETLSAPRVVTSESSRGVIETGYQIPYSTSSSKRHSNAV